MKTTLSILLIVLFSMFIPCNKDSPELPAHHGLLKRKLHYMNFRETIPYSTSDYEYDSKDRLVKIQNHAQIELFEYNKNNELIKKYYYQIDGNSSILIDSTCYKYLNGNLIDQETITSQLADYAYSYQTRYEYENSKLIRKKFYRDHQFDRLTTYEYAGNLCIKEKEYNDSIGVELFQYRTHLYDNDKLSISTLTIAPRGIFKEASIQWIYYLYDEKGQLIIENAEQLESISALISYIYRYEYY